LPRFCRIPAVAETLVARRHKEPGAVIPPALAALIGMLPSTDSAILPPSELRHKRYLTIQEAVAYTGLPAGRIQDKARAGRINREGLRYRRADLDEL
jgi:hypothetical protein